MGHVQINLFGSFHVERDGKSVDEQLARSPKGMLLMQYLILAPRQTAEAKTLMQVMWPEENSTSPDTALKTLISRQRAAAGNLPRTRNVSGDGARRVSLGVSAGSVGGCAGIRGNAGADEAAGGVPRRRKKC